MISRLLLWGAPAAAVAVLLSGLPSWLPGGATLFAGLVLGLGAAAALLLLRLLRWQLLLRSAAVRVPFREVARGYAVGLVGLATPGYVGELLRLLPLRRHVPLRRVVLPFALDRACDVAGGGLVLVAAAGVAGDRWFLVGALVLVVLATPWLNAVRSVRRPPRRSARGVAVGDLLAAVAISAIAWSGPALAAGLVAAHAGLAGSTAHLLAIDPWTTLLPPVLVSGGRLAAGVGETLAGPAAAVLVPLTALAAALCVGEVVGLLRSRPPLDEEIHFDAIAEEYLNQWQPHVWQLLLNRRMDLLESAIPEAEARAGIGIDVGCGLGRQTLEMRGRGYRVIGVDPAFQLVRRAQETDGMAVASALYLPFASGSADFAYAIGVLHHLDGPEAQDVALKEVHRVLKPGGRFIVQESNVQNPLFLFYMSYLFPLLKSIDEGIEWWIPPPKWEGLPGFELKEIRYFTFLPDFIPQSLMGPALRLERRLERSRAAPFSVHYMGVLEKTAAGG